MASQLTKEQFMKECDRVIDNNGVFAETMIQIDQDRKESVTVKRQHDST